MFAKLFRALPPQVVRMGADNMLPIMERAIEAGHSVLIENMGESIDAVLNPVITRWGADAPQYIHWTA
jgi:ATP-binding dynein motor region